MTPFRSRYRPCAMQGPDKPHPCHPCAVIVYAPDCTVGLYARTGRVSTTTVHPDHPFFRIIRAFCGLSPPDSAALSPYCTDTSGNRISLRRYHPETAKAASPRGSRLRLSGIACLAATRRSSVTIRSLSPGSPGRTRRAPPGCRAGVPGAAPGPAHRTRRTAAPAWP